LDVDFPIEDENSGGYPPPVAESKPAPEFLARIKGILDPDQITTQPEIRLRHGHGHTVSEINALRITGFARVPDYVVYPADETQVASLVQAAGKSGVVLMPHGGGTNVTEALRCLLSEERPIVSVDMSRMSRIEWIDPVNRMAKIQAGAPGRAI
jgi:alkyldihydroxyacetonephosphate synthase